MRTNSFPMQIKGNVTHPFTCKNLFYIYSGLISISIQYSAIMFAMTGVGVRRIRREKKILKSVLASIKKNVSFLGNLDFSRGITSI